MKTTELEIIQKAIIKNGVQAQVDVAIEEMSELIKALLKWRRAGITADLDLYAAIKEEIADVEIMLEQLKILYADKETVEHNEIKQFKLIRLANRLGMKIDEVELMKNE